MIITVNGQSREVAGGATIATLLAELRMELERVAVEHNRAILPKSRFSETPLANGDTVEIVHFVGGG